jgi:putative transposase
MQENKQLSKLFWGRHLWARGYFVATSGNITDEVIMDYIKNQDDNKNDTEEFTTVD